MREKIEAYLRINGMWCSEAKVRQLESDYKKLEIALEEGSNMLRVGSAIFGERNYN